MPPCGSLYRISVSFIKVVIIIMQAFSVKLKFHVFCCKTSIFFCAYLHCDGHCLYFYSLFIISCLFSAKSFTYCSYPLYNFLRRMLYNKITAREQKPRCKPPQTSNYSQHINLSLTSITKKEPGCCHENSPRALPLIICIIGCEPVKRCPLCGSHGFPDRIHPSYG